MSRIDVDYEFNNAEHSKRWDTYNGQRDKLVAFLDKWGKYYKEALADGNAEAFAAMGNTLNSLHHICGGGTQIAGKVIQLINDLNSAHYCYKHGDYDFHFSYHNSEHVFNIINGIYLLKMTNLITDDEALILTLAAAVHDGHRYLVSNINGDPTIDKVRTGVSASLIYNSFSRNSNDWGNAPSSIIQTVLSQCGKKSDLLSLNQNRETTTRTIYDIVIDSAYPYDDKEVSRLSCIFRDLDRLSSWFGVNSILNIYSGLFIEIHGDHPNSNAGFLTFAKNQIDFMQNFKLYSVYEELFKPFISAGTEIAMLIAEDAVKEFSSEQAGILLV